MNKQLEIINLLLRTNKNSSQGSFGNYAYQYINSLGDISSNGDRRLTTTGQLHSWDAERPITVINRGLIK